MKTALAIFGEILKLTVLAGLTLAGILVILIWKRDLTTKVTYLRLLVQVVSVVVIYYIFTYSIWMLLLLGIILIMTIGLGRFFCGWICPFGLYSDIITIFRKVSKIRYRSLPERLNSALHKLRYVLLLFFLILPFFLGPIEPWQWPLALFLTGPFKPISVLLSPLEPLIIPWAGSLELLGINFSYPYVTIISFYSPENLLTILIFTFIALTILGSFIYRRFWCRFCPTGGSLGILNRFKGFKWAPLLHIDKDEEKCTKCGICKRVCPLQVTEVYEQKGGKIMTSMCQLCTRCVEMCPYEDCLKIKFGGKTVFKSRNWLEPSEVR
jgi:polyferredoxin